MTPTYRELSKNAFKGQERRKNIAKCFEKRNPQITQLSSETPKHTIIGHKKTLEKARKVR